MASTFQYKLDSHKKHTCPACGHKKRFVRYINTQTGAYLGDDIGRCDRENTCQYHKKPSRQTGSWRDSDLHLRQYTPTPAPEPVTYIPMEKVTASMKAYDKNNLMRWIAGLIGESAAAELAAKYYIGTSRKWKNDNGFGVVFWQIDAQGRPRQAKAMGYCPNTGKRLKDGQRAQMWHEGKYIDVVSRSKVAFLGKQLMGDQANLAQCFFGEHLLTLHPDMPVCIVESEKTALLMSVLKPHAVWLATGGSNGAKWDSHETYAVLKGRRVVLFPDCGMPNKNTGKTPYEDWRDKAKILLAECDSVEVSDLLETVCTDEERQSGFDLLDYLLPIIDKARDSARQSRGDDQPSLEAVGANVEANTLPPGFEVIEVQGGRTLQVDGLPAYWLNDEELSAALERIKGSEAQLIKVLHPNVEQLFEVFGLEVESVEVMS